MSWNTTNTLTILGFKALLIDYSHLAPDMVYLWCIKRGQKTYIQFFSENLLKIEIEEVAAAVVNEDLVVEEEPTDKITTTETEDEKNDLTLQVGGKEVKKIPIVNINR